MRFRLEVRITPADIGKRVVIRWRPPGLDATGQVTDVLGILENADPTSFAVRTRDGQLAVIPRTRALAGKVIPPPPGGTGCTVEGRPAIGRSLRRAAEGTDDQDRAGGR